MRICVAQHVPFEGPGLIAEWAVLREVELLVVRLFDGEVLPDREQLEGLIVLGGPMGIYDEEKYPWLLLEKQQIRLAIDDAKPVFGICLGAQLIADALGAAVFPGVEKEIGWFDVLQCASNPFLQLPEPCTVLHWHGDTFDLPENAECLGSTLLTPNQGFAVSDGLVALQFHIETTPESLDALIEHSAEELAEAGDFIQTPQELRAGLRHLPVLRPLLFGLLDRLFLGA